MSTEPDYVLLYETAESQAGYFTARQARHHGISWERLSDNVKRGRFLRLFRGVYRLAHFPSSAHEDLFVAWLRTDPHSLISHEIASTLYNLSDVLPGEIHVIIPRMASGRRPGLRLHTNMTWIHFTGNGNNGNLTTLLACLGKLEMTHLNLPEKDEHHSPSIGYESGCPSRAN